MEIVKIADNIVPLHGNRDDLSMVENDNRMVNRHPTRVKPLDELCSAQSGR